MSSALLWLQDSVHTHTYPGLLSMPLSLSVCVRAAGAVSVSLLSLLLFLYRCCCGCVQELAELLGWGADLQSIMASHVSAQGKPSLWGTGTASTLHASAAAADDDDDTSDNAVASDRAAHTAVK